MTSGAHKRPQPFRVAVAVVSSPALIGCAACVWLLYTGPAPFHQPYQSATSDQNAAVTLRLIAALIGLPLAIFGTLVALACDWFGRNPRPWLFWLSAISFLASLHAFGVRLSLPYGFGSGYQHASTSQIGHMSIAFAVAAIFLLVAIASNVAAKVTPTKAAPPLCPS